MRTLALLLAISATAFAQCTVDGTVVNSITGAPIERVHLSITAAGDTFFSDSDATGKWTIEHISCEHVSVLASRPGYLQKVVTATSPTHDLNVPLAPQAVLAGRVLDEQGDPILGAQVSLMTSRVINGVRGTQASTSLVTNDLGEYRFSGLSAGKYSVCANPGGGALIYTGGRSYGDKCYPGSLPMDVAAGYEGRIDLTLTPLVTVQVSGVVSGGESAGVMLVPRDQIARMSIGLSVQARKDGTFTIKHVPPASYTAFATSGRMSASMPVSVGATDIDSLRLHIEPGANVTGTVKPTPASAMYVQLVRDLATDGVAFSQLAEWNPDRTAFTLSDIPAGNYRVQLTPPAHFYVKSATMGGRDISNADFMIAPGMANIEVVIADDGGTIEGDASAAAWVLVQKDGVSHNARTDASGHFKIESLPPGDYKVYAWDDNTNIEYGRPEWMRQNAKGVAVSVAPGQTAQVRITRQTAPPI